MSKWLWALPLAALGILPFVKSDPPPQDDRRPHVEVAHPQRKTIYRKLRVPGEVRPFQETGIYARLPGYIGDVLVDRGTWVEPGAVLAKIEVPELEKRLEKEKAERDWRKAIWERLDKIAQKSPNLINGDLLDDSKGRYDVSAAQVRETETILECATVKAPFAGVISERWIDRGTLVQPAQTKMFHLVQGDKVRVRIHVAQSDVPSVRPESMADITVAELSGFKASVKASRLFWALNKDTKTMAVEVDVENKGEDRTKWVRPGMYAHVTLDLDARPDVLVVPAGALIVEKKKRFVYTVQDGVAKKTEIEVGLDNGIEVEVKKGLEETHDVVVAGKNLVSDGDKVRVTRR